MFEDQETEFDETPKPVPAYRLDDLIGHVLDGRYEIDELIGTGAMGAVFRARQLRLRRTVALKVPRPEVLKIPNYRGRFEREALTMAKLVHQNIVQIFDVYISEEPKEPSFITMEFVEGREFGEYLMLEKNNLTISAVLLILEQIAAALDAAHAYGVVHRDVKPSNILITMPQRIPKIMDFGIAKVEIEDAFQTINMETLGTPAYMSPEQVTGGVISSKTDVYSFGVMAYKTLTGHFPHDVERTDIRHVMQAHVSKEIVPASKRNPTLPPELDRLFIRVLEKNPNDRPPTATEFIHGVREVLQEIEQQPLSFILPTTESERTVALRYQKQNAKKQRKEIIIISALFFAIIALFGVIFALSKAKTKDLDVADSKSSTVETLPTPTPEATPELPASTPEAALSTPEPTPDPTPSPTPRPNPTATPAPRKTPAPTPEPTPLPTQPPAPTNTPEPASASRLYPEPTGEQITSAALKIAMQKRFVEMMDKQIENPSFYGRFTPEENALARMGGPEAQVLIDKMQAAKSTHSMIDLSFKIADSSRYWDSICLLEVEPSIRALPLNHRDRTFREVIYVAPKTVKLVIQKNNQGTWNFVCFGCP